MAIYVKVDGIEGNATHEEHVGWITAESASFGVGRAISTPTGSTMNREATEPSISEFNITKLMDESSSPLCIEACVGKEGKEVTVHMVSTGSPGETYQEWILSDCLISGYSASSGGDRPVESISFNFTKFELNYTAGETTGAAGGSAKMGYDISTAAKT